MEELFTYLLKSAGVLSIFVLVYHFLLRRLTFFQANRWFLLFGMLASVLLPSIQIVEIVYVQPPQEQLSTADLLMLLQQQESTTPVIKWSQLLGIAYAAVSLFLLGKIVLELLSLRKLMRSGKCRNQDGFVRISLSRKVTPFSFFNRICFYGPEENTAASLLILKHEQVHAREWHSLDLILTHIYCALFWANPLSWWLKRQVGENLEFIADATAKVENTSGISYERTLLSSAASHMQPTLANNFFTPFIKKRILMLQKETSKKWNAYKYALILPVIVLFMYSFNTVTHTRYIDIENASLGKEAGNSTIDHFSTIVDGEEMIQIKIKATDTQADFDKHIAYLKEKYNVDLTIDNVKYTNGKIVRINIALDDNKGYKGSQNYSDSNGISSICITGNITENSRSWNMGACDATGNKQFVFQSNASDLDQMEALKDLDSVYNVLGRFKIMNTDSLMDLYKSDFAKAQKEMQSMDSDALRNQLKQAQAQIRKLNIDSIMRSVEIARKSMQQKMVIRRSDSSVLGSFTINGKSRGIFLADKDSLMPDIWAYQNRISVPDYYRTNPPLYVLNGTPIDEAEMDEINSRNIESISVLKDANATALYGDKGKNGVVLITTKVNGNQPKPLIIIDGKEKGGMDMDDIDPNSVKSINVLKDKPAMEKYGKKGENGVLEIELKKKGDPAAKMEKTGYLYGNNQTFYYINLEDGNNSKIYNRWGVEVFNLPLHITDGISGKAPFNGQTVNYKVTGQNLTVTDKDGKVVDLSMKKPKK